MNKSSSKYFLPLDNDVPQEVIQSYKTHAKGNSNSTLMQRITLLGSKIPLPPSVALTHEFFSENHEKVGEGTLGDLGQIVNRFEKLTQGRFGGREKPLLLNVTGGYCGSIRNIGVNPGSLAGLVHSYGAGFAYALYVDFLESFSTLVLGIRYIDFRKTFGIVHNRTKKIDGLGRESEQDFLKKVRDYQNLVSQKIGRPFPERPEQHLLSILNYCLRCARKKGSDEVLIQTQYYPTYYGQSVHGITFSRNPFTGKRDLYGAFQWGNERKKASLVADESKGSSKRTNESLKNLFPNVYSDILSYLPKIESCFLDVVEAEFVTDEDGHLQFVRFDKADVTTRASVVSTLELNRTGVLSDDETALRIKPKDVEILLHPTLDDQSRASLEDLGSTGTTAAPGTAVGRVFFNMKDAMEYHREASSRKADSRVILITDELLISDSAGLGIISGLVTKASGISSHAAVMARSNGIPCVVGYLGLEVDPKGKSCRVQSRVLRAGTLVTLDAGAVGRIYLREGTIRNLSFRDEVIQEVSQLMGRVISQERIPIKILVNINGPKDAEVGLSFGADGVGLCRTENMFMEPKALREIRNIIFTKNSTKTKASFKALEEMQYQDFRKIFETMGSRPVNIRLMDMPLHDFVPQTNSDLKKVKEDLPHLKEEQIRVVSDGLREHNPMLGLRACRFGLITPEVYDLQIRAIVRAAYSVGRKDFVIHPGIMFPLVLLESELVQLKKRVVEIEEEIRQELKIHVDAKIKIRVGTMIELPGAALGADHLARVGEFFAFGTNDLTQTSLGMSRDDSAHYLPHYFEKNLIAKDPFKVLSDPVKELLELAVWRGRRVRPDASFGICGEQGGDPSSLVFCLEKGLNYVSCSPFRVLPTRVSLVHVALKNFSHVELRESRALVTSNKDESDPSLTSARAA